VKASFKTFDMISFPNNFHWQPSKPADEPNTPVRVLVAEPDAVSRRLICAMLEKEPDIKFQYIDTSEVVAAIHKFCPDLVIVDIQTPAIRRAANWEALGIQSPPATILTSYHPTSLMPVPSAGTDLLIKPFDVEQFESAMEAARSKIADARARLSAIREYRGTNDPVPENRKFLHRFAAECEGRIVLIKVRDVLWLQSFGNYIRVHSATATHLVRNTMQNIQSLLDPNFFLRIHRNVIVNLDHVVEFFLPAAGNMFVKLDNGLSLPLRRSSRTSLRKLLKQHSLV
jgi:two-component system LytT family response regulator